MTQDGESSESRVRAVIGTLRGELEAPRDIGDRELEQFLELTRDWSPMEGRQGARDDRLVLIEQLSQAGALLARYDTGRAAQVFRGLGNLCNTKVTLCSGVRKFETGSAGGASGWQGAKYPNDPLPENSARGSADTGGTRKTPSTATKPPNVTVKPKLDIPSGPDPEHVPQETNKERRTRLKAESTDTTFSGGAKRTLAERLEEPLPEERQKKRTVKERVGTPNAEPTVFDRLASPNPGKPKVTTRLSRPQTALPSRTQTRNKLTTPETAVQAEPEAAKRVIPPTAEATNPEPEAELEEYGMGDEPVDYSDYTPLSDPEPEAERDDANTHAYADASDHEQAEANNHDEDADLDDAEYPQSDEEGELSI